MAKESPFDTYLQYLKLEKERDLLGRSRDQAQSQLAQAVSGMRDALARGSDGEQFRPDVETHHARLKELTAKMDEIRLTMSQLEIVLPSVVRKN